MKIPPDPTDRETLELLQLRKLRELLRAVLPANEFYRRKCETVGITSADDIAAMSDFARLPLTTKGELSEDQRTRPPFGTNLTYPAPAFVRVHQTSGSTGAPLRWLDTPESWAWWARCWSEVYRAAGVRSDDRVFFAFSFGPFIGFWSAMAGAEALGCLTIPGGGMTSEQRVNAILDHQATVLVSTPTYGLHLAEAARQPGLDPAASHVRVTIHAGEPGAGVPQTRRRLEAAWGAACFDHAGATEVGAWGFECAHRAGLHINEAEFIAEVIDPRTGQPADEGELVITNLGRAGMPVLRYRSGDHVRLDRSRCACGRSFVRCVGGVQGRVDDALIVRGVNVFPSAIENILRRHVASGEFQLEATRRGELDELRVRVETEADSASAASIARDIRQQLGLRSIVESVPPGTLPRQDVKAKRFIDRRSKRW